MPADGQSDGSTQAPGVAAFDVEDPRAQDVRLLVEELDAEMAGILTCTDCDLTSVEALSEDYVQFLVARYHGHPIACGALVIKDIDWAEIKRMYVRPVVRGKGLSRAVLNNLLTMARRRDLRTVRLETNVRSVAAVSLYRSAGFQPCDAYEAHQATAGPDALFMALTL